MRIDSRIEDLIPTQSRKRLSTTQEIVIPADQVEFSKDGHYQSSRSLHWI
jgi:hypothetical protein